MNRKKKITIREIAEKANVSISTVSRVINGTANVREKRRRRVEQVIEEHNFQPSTIARQLGKGKSQSIGIITQYLPTQVFTEAIHSFVSDLEKLGYSAVLGDANFNAEQEKKLTHIFIEHGFDGMVIIGSMQTEAELLSLKKKIPLTLLLKHYPSLSKHCFAIDNQASAEIAVSHLVELGHRRIAHITGHLHEHDAQERIIGYKKSLENANIPFDPTLLIEGDFSTESGKKAIHHLLKEKIPFSALFCSNDNMAIGANQALSEAGYHVPKDVSLVGHDNMHISQYITPALTTICTDYRKLAEDGVQNLIAQIEKKPFAGYYKKPELYIRKSTQVHEDNV